MGSALPLFVFFLMVSGFVPLALAWHHNGRTTLRPALGWVLAAWAIWTVLSWEDAFDSKAASPPLRFLALCLTACPGIAVLGARRPGVGAWNLVVLALLLVLLLPIAEGLGALQLGGYHILLLACTLTLAFLNYLPTRLALAAALIAFACVRQLNNLHDEVSRPPAAVFLTLGAAPWLGWICWRTDRKADGEFARAWRDFRDRFGWFWAQRVREQFNRVAANAGWPLVLGWRGLQRHGASTTPTDAEVVATLRALLQRFCRQEGQREADSHYNVL